MSRTLEGKTLFISGGSRGIGLAIALRAARDGANVALIAKTAEPHPKLEGTVYTAAEEIEAAGGQALPIVGDIRDEAQVADAVDAGGRALRRHRHLRQQRERDQPARHRGARDEALRPDAGHQHARHLLVSKACIPHLKQAENPHVLTLSPPISLDPKWLGGHIGYTIAKYGMSLCTLGMAEEFARRRDRLQLALAADADRHRRGPEPARRRRGDGRARAGRRSSPTPPTRSSRAPSRECTGNLFLAEDVLAEEGVTDLAPYAYERRRRAPSTSSST